MGCKLIYELEQITPIIHFQCDEVGVSLRASEVKPKLDKYIKERCIQNGIEIKSEWYLPDEKAFRYKMKISVDPETKVSKTDNWTKTKYNKIPMYFGNMQGSATKCLVFYDKPLNLEFICFSSSLMQVINKYIKAFFVLHNFGTRQSKGYGGFLVKGTDVDYELSQEENHTMNAFAMVASKCESHEMLKQFRRAKDIYDVMKSGINNGGVIKGYLRTMKYFDPTGKKNLGGDKKFIKNYLFEPDKDYKEQTPANQYYYVRALLGLAENYEFRAGNRGKYGSDRQGTVKIKSANVSRFKSPITIKITSEKIYFLPEYNELPDEILNEKFEFYVTNDKNNKKVISHPTKNTLKTPENFDVSDFLISFSNWFNTIPSWTDMGKQGFEFIREIKIEQWERKS